MKTAACSLPGQAPEGRQALLALSLGVYERGGPMGTAVSGGGTYSLSRAGHFPCLSIIFTRVTGWDVGWAVAPLRAFLGQNFSRSVCIY